MGRKRQPGTPDATMQLDAVVDDLEEVEAPALAEMHSMTAPPPLPPKKAGASAWLVGSLVVLLAAGAAVGIGLVLRSLRTPAPTPVTAAEPPAAPADEPPEAEPATVQMEAFVFDEDAPPAEADEPAAPAEAPEATDPAE